VQGYQQQLLRLQQEYDAKLALMGPEPAGGAGGGADGLEEALVRACVSRVCCRAATLGAVSLACFPGSIVQGRVLIYPTPAPLCCVCTLPLQDEEVAEEAEAMARLGSGTVRVQVGVTGVTPEEPPSAAPGTSV
jgi:hypothetical protein